MSSSLLSLETAYPFDLDISIHLLGWEAYNCRVVLFHVFVFLLSIVSNCKSISRELQAFKCIAKNQNSRPASDL